MIVRRAKPHVSCDVVQGESVPVADPRTEPVDMVIDPWKPAAEVRYRFETFCCGPKACELYRPGPTRKVPGRKGVTWEEADWVDKDATAHRAADE